MSVSNGFNVYPNGLKTQTRHVTRRLNPNPPSYPENKNSDGKNNEKRMEIIADRLYMS